MRSMIRRAAPAVAVAALLALAGGCASSSKTVEATAASEAEGAQARDAAMAQRRAAMQMVCPLAIDGTEVDAEDTTGGVALEFETDDDEMVEELRARVRRMAEMHEQHRAAASAGAMQPGTVEPAPTPGTATSPPGTGGTAATSQPGMMGRGMGMGRGGMGGMMAMHADIRVPATTRVVDVGDGARIVFEPTDLSQLDELRRQVRAHAKKMDDLGECPMTASGPDFD